MPKNIFDSIGGALQDVGKAVGGAAANAGKAVADVTGAIGKNADATGKVIGKAAKNVAKNVSSAGEAVSKNVFQSLDQDGNGKVDITDIIILGLKAPGVRIVREDFLRTQFARKYDPTIIDKAIASTPFSAGIPSDDIDNMADACIAYERNIVSGISTALGTPGGFAMAATIPADIVQYYGVTLRAAQKLMYLYGFPDIGIPTGDSPLDDATMNLLILSLGAMYGVAGANNAIKAVALALGKGVEKQLMKKALTKGALYPIIKSILKWFGVNLTKKAFAGFFKNAIPLLGGVIGGTITFVSFGPCCNNLKKNLRDTYLSRGDQATPVEGNIIMGDPADYYEVDSEDSSSDT